MPAANVLVVPLTVTMIAPVEVSLTSMTSAPSVPVPIAVVTTAPWIEFTPEPPSTFTSKGGVCAATIVTVSFPAPAAIVSDVVGLANVTVSLDPALAIVDWAVPSVTVMMSAPGPNVNVRFAVRIRSVMGSSPV